MAEHDIRIIVDVVLGMCMWWSFCRIINDHNDGYPGREVRDHIERERETTARFDAWLNNGG